MSETTFNELGLSPEMQRAVEEMGFTAATEIQAQAIPLLRTGADVIGRSQTGTGKTVAFGIPAVEKVDPALPKDKVQVLILCPTRELAQQGCDEIRKLTRFSEGISAADVYGGAPMDRQITRLKHSNVVIGTPGRVMDHMRRRTIDLSETRMVVLDEADEMLSMGFVEDMETILSATPEERQTVLFSATMPPEILALTKKFQKDPQMIAIHAGQVTLENIHQQYVEVPMGRKMDALNLLLRFYTPTRAMIFCNTKKMVEELATYLHGNGFDAEGLHGDLNQSQRTRVMDGFKSGKTTLLVATDVAARGIDVNDIDYVFNYDIPQDNDYYVHRIGRTGRAGKSGVALTICSGRRQVSEIQMLARIVKSEIRPVEIPTTESIRLHRLDEQTASVAAAAATGIDPAYRAMVDTLLAQGCSLPDIAAAALQMQFHTDECHLEDIRVGSRGGRSDGPMTRLQLSIGRNTRVAPNHIVSAIADRTGIAGSEIGKIEIFDDRTVVGVPAARAQEIADLMTGCKICGQPVRTELLGAAPQRRPMPGRRPDSRRPVGASYGHRPAAGNRRPASRQGYAKGSPSGRK